MKFSPIHLLGILLLTLLASACTDPCENKVDEEVGDEFFTVTYLTPAGENYLEEVYNPANIVVFLDTTGGQSASPRFEAIRPGYNNGKFGPFFFTERFVSPIDNGVNQALLLGKRFNYDYYIKKDTFGIDTLKVSFLLEADECHFYWRDISYSVNGIPLIQNFGQQQADIVIRE
jgi:hypothetical protein